MAPGSGKNQDDIQTKELGVRPEESSAAAAAAAASAAPAPPSERLQEPPDGPPEAGGQNPSSATSAEAAAAATRKGKGIAVAASSGRATEGGEPSLPPRAASVSSVWEPRPASGKPPLPPRASSAAAAEIVASDYQVRTKWKEEFDKLLAESEKAKPKEMPREQMNSPTVRPEKYNKRSLCRKLSKRIARIAHYSIPPTMMVPHLNQCICRKNMLVLVVLLGVAYLPTGAEGFQQFKSVKEAAEKLILQDDLNDIRMLLREEMPVPGINLGLWGSILGAAIFACLVAGLASRFVADPRQEPAPPVRQQPQAQAQAPEVDFTATLVLVLVLVTVVVVAARCIRGAR